MKPRRRDDVSYRAALPWVLVAATLVGAALRFHALGERDLWMDEACTWYFISDASAFDFTSRPLIYENASRVYYMLLSFWTALAGDDAWGMRSFSAVLGTLTIPLAGVWLRRLAGPLAGMVGAILVAAHPLHVYYSREARFYPLWMVELIGLLWLLSLAAKRNEWRIWSAYAFVLLATLWTHYFTLYWLPVSLLAVLLAERRAAFLRCWAIVHGVAAAIFAPWFVAVVVPLSARGNADWITSIFHDMGPWTAIPRTCWVLSPAGHYPPYLGTLIGAGNVLGAVDVAGHRIGVVALAGAAVFVSGLVGFAWPGGKTSPERAMPARERAFYVLALCAPLLFAWLYSVVRQPIYVAGRYDQVAWPAAMVLLAVGLTNLGRRWRSRVLVPTLIALAAACALATTVTALAVPPSHTDSRLLARLERLARPGDRIICLGMTRWSLRPLVTASRRRPPTGQSLSNLRSFPAVLDEQVGWQSPARMLEDRQALQQEAETLARELRRHAQAWPGARVWIIFQDVSETHPTADPRWQVDWILHTALRDAGATLAWGADDAPFVAYAWPAASPTTEPDARQPAPEPPTKVGGKRRRSLAQEEVLPIARNSWTRSGAGRGLLR